ncbi:MAG: insulinase family protein [Gemmatimonadetes bacterium]|nr:insulinase family protein [Gemmatimonadota bacterium]
MSRGVGSGCPSALLVALGLVCFARPAPSAQQAPPVGKPAIEALRFPPLRFEPPEPVEFRLRNGVKVFFIEDHSLPLIYLSARFKGGAAHFDRGLIAVTTAVPALLRNGGTRSLPPDSVDALIELYALDMAFGSGGQSSFSSVSALTRHFDLALELWADMILNPHFDSTQVEVWRGRELETVRRRPDSPSSLTISEFNHLMFGDHPVGWIMEPEDLEPADLAEPRLRRVHREIFCRENLLLGITGDVRQNDARAKLERVLAKFPPCPRELPHPLAPRIRREGGVFLIPKALNQSTVVVGQPGGIRQGNTPDFFASRVANSILGASGFTSRLLSRVRSQKGYAYSASSFWTAPLRYEGVVGALTQTKSETTVAAIRLIREIIEEMRAAPPTDHEVSVVIDDFVNGFVFNFEDPAQIVSRRMAYMAEGLPFNWLELFLDGIQKVTPPDVHGVMRRYLRPDSLTILVVGDSTKFDEPLRALGFGAPTIIEPKGVMR